jgi:formyltetrahydrofolate deformylase
MNGTAILLIDCPDRKGLVATISSFLYDHDANILHADQHQDNDAKLFFMRVEWSLADFDLDHDSLREQFQPIAERFEMRWRLEYSDARPGTGFCLEPFTLLSGRALPSSCRRIRLPHRIDREQPCGRSRAGKVLRNPFHHMPIDRGSKERTEQRQLELLEQNGIDLIVLARYMQVLSPSFVAVMRNNH